MRLVICAGRSLCGVSRPRARVDNEADDPRGINRGCIGCKFLLLCPSVFTDPAALTAFRVVSSVSAWPVPPAWPPCLDFLRGNRPCQAHAAPSSAGDQITLGMKTCRVVAAMSSMPLLCAGLARLLAGALFERTKTETCVNHAMRNWYDQGTSPAPRR